MRWIVTVAGALFLGAVSTFGDWVWAQYIPTHETIWGLAHGVVLCVCLGLVLALGAGGGRAWRLGLLVEPLVGLVAAALFYLSAGLLGWSAMYAAWMVLWLLTSLLFAQMLPIRPPLKSTLLRGLLAALGSGLAFWSIADIWLAPPADGPNYPWHLCAWTIAFLPGLAALFVGGARPADD